MRYPTRMASTKCAHCGLYHLNAYTYADPEWFPDMDPELREMFERVTRGALSGQSGRGAERGLQGQWPIC